ncbi:hypothetical protein FYJ28_01380 [Arthrobacter sp. BL-252-APC-1A]|uniref:hypothetical protein n=1 Tax=Arthrobacter sp. BL-252-APC-1A TaxID=2606622 RepID=UPI0012B2493A|nr:hypothetical protein [Arthrobacter sp. BL-252-APC-1A]MSR97471.1 hypothetical protein [Arthrobacter sp. BL-252-APC-1A]
MSTKPARASRKIFLLIPFGAVVGMGLGLLNFQLRLADTVESGDAARFILWTLIGGAVLGGSFTCSASVAAHLSASAGRSRAFCAGAAALVLGLCWLLLAGVSGISGLALVAAGVLTAAAAGWFVWFSTK